MHRNSVKNHVGEKKITWLWLVLFLGACSGSQHCFSRQLGNTVNNLCARLCQPRLCGCDSVFGTTVWFSGEIILPNFHVVSTGRIEISRIDYYRGDRLC